jgi:hypothetical protein
MSRFMCMIVDNDREVSTNEPINESVLRLFVVNVRCSMMNMRRQSLNFVGPLPRGRDGKELVQCPTSSCDGMGHVSGNYATHRRQGIWYLAYCIHDSPASFPYSSSTYLIPHRQKIHIQCQNYSTTRGRQTRRISHTYNDRKFNFFLIVKLIYSFFLTNHY